MIFLVFRRHMIPPDIEENKIELNHLTEQNEKNRLRFLYLHQQTLNNLT